MKNILIISFLLILGLKGYGQDNNITASCCDSKESRCTGSASCSACTNCSKCGYCNNGGSCGVCSGRKTNTYNNNNNSNFSHKKHSYPTIENVNFKDNGYHLPDDVFSEYYLNTLLVISETLNLRTGPDTKYSIVEQLKQNQQLTFRAMKGDWIKVLVKSSNTIGYVHYKYVVVLTK